MTMKDILEWIPLLGVMVVVFLFNLTHDFSELMTGAGIVGARTVVVPGIGLLEAVVVGGVAVFTVLAYWE